MADFLLDTGVLIKALRGRTGALDLIADINERATPYVSVVTYMEVMAGMHPREEPQTLDLLKALVTVPVTLPIADRAGRWMYAYARQGIQLSAPDTLIAATAARYGLILVTTNARHFPMPEVTVQSFAAH